MKCGVASWSGLHIFSVEKNFSLLPPLILSKTGLEQSQRWGGTGLLGLGILKRMMEFRPHPLEVISLSELT